MSTCLRVDGARMDEEPRLQLEDCAAALRWSRRLDVISSNCATAPNITEQRIGRRRETLPLPGSATARRVE